jgi:hypothetical protein
MPEMLTVYVVPVPDTVTVLVPGAVPPTVTPLLPKPVTDELKVAVKLTGEALVAAACAAIVTDGRSLMTVTLLLALLAAVQLWNTAVTTYVYVPSATGESLQLVVVTSVAGAVPHAADATPLANRCT